MQEHRHKMRTIELLFRAGLFASAGPLGESKPEEYKQVGPDPEESENDPAHEYELKKPDLEEHDLEKSDPEESEYEPIEYEPGKPLARQSPPGAEITR